MSSAPEGWYVDPSTGTNLRFWNGSTWTDEVAPLPYDPTSAGAADLFGRAGAAPEPQREIEAEREAAPVAEPRAEPANDHPSGLTPDARRALPMLDLDATLERTRLTRRELRSRHGVDAQTEDTPRHLPAMKAPAAASPDRWSEPVEELEIPASPSPGPGADATEDDPWARRTWLVRMSVLLAFLAIASTVAILTAGSL